MRSKGPLSTSFPPTRATSARLLAVLSVLFVAALARAETGPALLNLRAVTPAGPRYQRPYWFPDNRHLAITTPKFEGLLILDADAREAAPIVVSKAPRAGYGFAIGDDGVLWFREPSDIESGLPFVIRHYSLKAFDIVTSAKAFGPASVLDAPDGGAFAWADADGRVTTTSHGVLTREPGLYNPALSRNGRWLLVHDTRGHVRLLSLRDNAWTDIGEAYHASFSLDAEWILFELSRDDGHVITSSGIWAYHTATGIRVALSQGDPRVPMRPACSADGKRLACVAEDTGQILVGELELRTVKQP